VVLPGRTMHANLTPTISMELLIAHTLVGTGFEQRPRHGFA
jgi:hypothetical protein